MQNIQICLTSSGASTGPTFDLYSNADGFSVPFETGVSKAALIACYTTNLVPDAATIVRLVSVGACTNFIDLTIVGLTTTTTTTTTSTTTTTTTVPVVYDFYVANRYGCPVCSADMFNIIVAADSATPLSIGGFYGITGGGIPYTYAYEILSVTVDPLYSCPIMDASTGSISCAILCAIV